ncbi:MAG: ABC transporter ATP-binding protein [Clostridia bacterium]|nr:ABC transporter ATP-binding protein [Clostridia bacterium]
MMLPHKKVLLLCALLLMVITVLDLYRPILIGDAIDRFITGPYGPGEEAEARFLGVVRAGAIYIVILVALFFFTRWQRLMLQKTGQQIIYDLRNRLFEHMEGLDLKYFDVTPVGKIVTRITNDAESINEVYSNILAGLLLNTVKVAALAVIMLILNARMALYSFLLVPLAAFLTVMFRKLSKKAFRITKTRVTALNTFLSEHLSGMKLIRIFGREKAKYDEFCDKSEDLYRANFREVLVGALFRPGTYLVSAAALALILYLGSVSVLDGTVSIGTMYIFLQYINSLFAPIQELAEQFSTLQSAVASAEKIFTLLDTPAAVVEKPDCVSVPRLKGRIEFDHVWFAYNGEDYVLKDVSFTIEPGQKVAFVGATGAGKSSILNLIGRYYDIQKGSIRIDGNDIRDLKLGDLRASIGQVQQDVFLFTGDISSNIRLRSDGISDEAVRDAAEHVNAARFIERLPNGYHEKVSEGGATFSSGQRQLISFARTLAADPSILVLDEATSNIDTETEIWIREALERLMRGRTTIMVAHRLSTVQNADRIIVIHHGRIRESGTHQELLEKNGIYKKLYLLQASAE